MAKNIISADPNGLCDPVVFFEHHGVQSKSSVYHKSLNPVWNERILLNTYIYDTYIPPIVMKVFDLDEHSLRRDDYECLGYSIIDLQSQTVFKNWTDANQIPELNWTIVRDESRSDNAHVLLSFTVV